MQVMKKDARGVYLKALIYGASGMGKTTFGCTAPKPLFLLSERQGYEHIEAAVARLGIEDPIVLYMSAIDDYVNVARTLRLGTINPEARTGPFVVKDVAGAVLFSHPTWPESVVLDSLTDACKLIEEDIRRISPPKTGKDGLPVDSERYWNVLGDRCEKLIRAFRDVDFHVLFLCIEDDRTVGEAAEAEPKVGPALPMRKLANQVAQATNVVGIMMRQIVPKAAADGTRDESEIRFAVRTVGPSYYLLKPHRPLKDIEIPDFGSWVTRIEEARRGTQTTQEEQKEG